MTATDNDLIQILDLSNEEDEVPSPRAAAPALPSVLPILGLADIVIFPGMKAPLVVESTQSIRLIDDVLAGDRFVGLVLQRRPEIENPVPDDLWLHGCAARILKMVKYPNNSVRILTQGLRRFRIREYESLAPYLRAQIEYLADQGEDTIEIVALTRNVRRLFEEAADLSPSISEETKQAVMGTEEPGRLTDLIAPLLNLGLEDRQHLLESVVVRDRLSRLMPLLNRELEVLTLGSKIQKEVASAMSKSQREFFLREQMRAIQRELGEPDPTAGEIGGLRELVDKNQLPEEAHKVALKELDRLQQIPPAVAEYTVIRNYVDWLINLPWQRATEDTLDLADAQRILDEQHYGLAKVKERLLEFIAVIKLNQQLKGPLLCLVGPPGVGKTSLGKSLADALGRKFARISLGGMRDEAEIRGHRRTYVGALPGRILQSLRRVESNNPVVLLDEIDKVGSDFRGDPSSALLEVLDPRQNSAFVDHYLDVPFDLSRVLFVTTANWLDPIHVALRDRLEVIELPSYTPSEKLQIARRYLVPRQLEEHGLSPQRIRFPSPTLRQLILDYTREAGVRQLEREVASLVRKSVRLCLNGRSPARRQKRPLTILPRQLAEMLGPPRYLAERAETLTEFGIATGLAWTPVGGDILFIEATRMPGKGQLILTGSLGDVMKESAQTALSYLRSQSRNLGIEFTDYDKYDIHIHVPAGATPKDGPSAGIAIVIALASLISRRLVRSDLAMSGEISLRGRVLPVGGVKEKVLAAARSGIKEVILPQQNEKDWIEVPQEIRQKMKVRFIHQISEAMAVALRPPGKGHPKPPRSLTWKT